MNNETPIRIIRWLFYAFLLSLPFEAVVEGLFEPTTILGAILALGVLLQPSLFLRWPPKGFWCFIVYLYLFATLSLLEPAAYRTLVLFNVFQLTQLTVLGWIGFSLMTDRETAERALLVFAVGCVLLAALQITGIASPAVAAEPGRIVRVTAFGFHPNNLARILMLGLLALVGLAMVRSKGLARPFLLTSPLILLLCVALIQTGSRGGLIALAAGIMTLVLRRGTVLRKVVNGACLLVVLGIFFLAAMQSEVMRSRFEETLEDGDLARRELIYPTAFQMFQEKPLLGWSPVASTYELGMRLGHPEEETKNPHNIVLYGLVSTGIIGTLPLLIGIGFATANAWKTRHGPHGVLPLAMVVAVLIANMSGVWLFNKLHWLVMAYAMAAIYHSARRSSELPVTSNDHALPARELVTI